MKTYTQKQYDNAKKRAFEKGVKFAETFPISDDTEDAVRNIKDWRKWEQFDFDWSVIALVAVCLIVTLTMIFTSHADLY